jgi:hypothetical protein
VRRRRRHAKTDRLEAAHLRELLVDGRLPECWIPPQLVLETRARVRLYKDLADQRTGWQQRMHALIDLYQGSLIELPDLQRRTADVEHRRRDLQQHRDALTAQRQQLTRDDQLRHRVRHFASRVLGVIDPLDFDQKQTLLRLVIEEVHVTGWHVQIRLRIPLDDNPDGPPRPPNPDPGPDRPGPVSTEDRLRSLGNQEVDLPEPLRSSTPRRYDRQPDRAAYGAHYWNPPRCSHAEGVSPASTSSRCAATARRRSRLHRRARVSRVAASNCTST